MKIIPLVAVLVLMVSSQMSWAEDWSIAGHLTNDVPLVEMKENCTLRSGATVGVIESSLPAKSGNRHIVFYKNPLFYSFSPSSCGSQFRRVGDATLAAIKANIQAYNGRDQVVPTEIKLEVGDKLELTKNQIPVATIRGNLCGFYGGYATVVDKDSNGYYVSLKRPDASDFTEAYLEGGKNSNCKNGERVFISQKLINGILKRANELPVSEFIKIAPETRISRVGGKCYRRQDTGVVAYCSKMERTQKAIHSLCGMLKSGFDLSGVEKMDNYQLSEALPGISRAAHSLGITLTEVQGCNKIPVTKEDCLSELEVACPKGAEEAVERGSAPQSPAPAAQSVPSAAEETPPANDSVDAELR